jgi:uncharacterized repeat protein (TIGR01451 family)
MHNKFKDLVCPRKKGVANLALIAKSFFAVALACAATFSLAQNIVNTVTATPPPGVTPSTSISATDTDCKLQTNKVIQTAPIGAGPTFSITYRVTVAASGCTTVGSYALTDTPLFGAPGITINSASAVNTVIGSGTMPAGGALAPVVGPYTLAPAATAIAAGATHQYDVTINYTVTAGITAAAETCSAPGVGSGQVNTGATAGGLRNRSTATATGGSARTVDACQSISVADIQALKAQRAGTTGAFQTTALSVNQGQIIQYQLTYTNAGPEAANGAIFADAIPSNITGVSIVSTTPSSGVTCSGSLAGNSLSGSVAAWPSAGTCTLLIQGTASTSGTVTNTTTVTIPAGIVDPAIANNTSSLSTIITLGDR